jgi:hypothetical protein
MFPIAHRPENIGDCRSGRPPAPASCIAELSKVSKIDKVEDSLDNPPKPTMIYDNLP